MEVGGRWDWVMMDIMDCFEFIHFLVSEMCLLWGRALGSAESRLSLGGGEGWMALANVVSCSNGNH